MGIEHRLELRVIASLQFVETLIKLAPLGEHLSNAHEGPHNLYIHIDRTLAAQDTRQHRHTLFRKGVWRCSSTTPSTRHHIL